MEEHRNQSAVERRLKEALKNDRARIQVGRIGNPVEKTFVLPRECATINDVWHVIGLKGTGSDTYAVDRCVRAGGSRHRLIMRSIPPSGANTARSTRSRSTSCSARAFPRSRSASRARRSMPSSNWRKPRRRPASTSLLRDNAVIQSQVGVAQAQLAAARAFFFARLGGDLAGGADRQRCRSTSGCGCAWRPSTPASRRRQVVETAYLAAGATAVFESNPFERRFRDMHAVSQQVQSHFSIFEVIGRHFLGLPPNSRLI